MIQDMPSENEYIDEFIQQQLMGDKDLREMVESFDLNNFLNNDQEQDNELMICCENSSSATSATSQSRSIEFSMQQDKNCNHTSDAFNIQENGINPDNFIENKAIKNNDLPHEPPIKCLVCSAPTINYHYDVSSCYSCKTFFRRCVVLSKLYKCKRTQNCDIIYNKLAYNLCKGCRLRRCIAAGMNAEAIKFHKGFDPTSCLLNFKEFKSKILPRYLPLALKTPQESIINEIDELLYIEDKIRRLRESSFNPSDLTFNTIQEILMKPTELSRAEKYEKPRNWPLSMDDLYIQIMECIKNMAVKGELGRKLPETPIIRFWIAKDNILIIEAAKTFPFFRLLSFEDQTILLRHISLVNTSLMECYYSFISNQNTIIMPDGMIPFKLKVELNGFINKQKSSFFSTTADDYLRQIFKFCCENNSHHIMEILQRFLDYTPIISIETLEDMYIRVLEPLKRVNLTEKEYVLLKTIIYCYNALPDLSEYARSILQKEAEKYSQLLLRYLQMEHGDIKGVQKYTDVISLMGTFFNIAGKHRQYFILHQLSRNPVRNRLHIIQSPIFMEEILHA